MKKLLSRIAADVESVLSSAEGSISSARILMFVLAIFGMHELDGMIRHMIALKDVTVLSLWMGGLPTFIAMFIALMAAPYTISKSASTINELVGSIQDRKNGSL